MHKSLAEAYIELQDLIEEISHPNDCDIPLKETSILDRLNYLIEENKMYKARESRRINTVNSIPITLTELQWLKALQILEQIDKNLIGKSWIQGLCISENKLYMVVYHGDDSDIYCWYSSGWSHIINKDAPYRLFKGYTYDSNPKYDPDVYCSSDGIPI